MYYFETSYANQDSLILLLHKHLSLSSDYKLIHSC